MHEYPVGYRRTTSFGVIWGVTLAGVNHFSLAYGVAIRAF